MRAEIITIGDEILIGQTVDTNSAYLGKKLKRIGLKVNWGTAIQDQAEAIQNSIDLAFSRSDVVIMTGGLGPTQDDITKSTLANYFGQKLVRNEEVLDRIALFFKQFNRPMLPVNEQQADLPEHCIVLDNLKGTASGMWFEKDGKILVSLPGVPFEMKHLFETQVTPRLLKLSGLSNVQHRVVMTKGIGESFLAEIIKNWEEKVRELGFSLAYLPNPGMVKLRISTYSGNDTTQSQFDALVKELKELIPEYFFSDGEISLSESVGELLKQRGKTLGVVESCTGGSLAHELTKIAGCSDYFGGGIVSYTNELKHSILGVQNETLNKFGAVSEATVKEMAEGGRRVLNVDYALATSGVAGPTGGSDEKPVGMVCYALATPEHTYTFTGHFGNTRDRVMKRAGMAALSALFDELVKKN